MTCLCSWPLNGQLHVDRSQLLRLSDLERNGGAKEFKPNTDLELIAMLGCSCGAVCLVEGNCLTSWRDVLSFAVVQESGVQRDEKTHVSKIFSLPFLFQSKIALILETSALAWTLISRWLRVDDLDCKDLIDL